MAGGRSRLTGLEGYAHEVRPKREQLFNQAARHAIVWDLQKARSASILIAKYILCDCLVASFCLLDVIARIDSISNQMQQATAICVAAVGFVYRRSIVNNANLELAYVRVCM